MTWYKVLCRQLPDGIEKITKNRGILLEIWTTGIQITKQGVYSMGSFPFDINYNLTNVQFEGMGRDSLRAGRSGDRIPVGATFSAPVQTGPGAPPASCTVGTGSFPGVKRPGRGADHPPPSSAEVMKG